MALFKNATVTFSTAIVDVTSVDVEFDGERITHSADVDTFLTFQSIVKKDRRITVNTDDATRVLGLTQGSAAGSLVVVLKTADGGSDVTLTVSAMVARISGGASHAAVDHGQTVEFTAVSADGTTDPVVKT